MAKFECVSSTDKGVPVGTIVEGEFRLNSCGDPEIILSSVLMDQELEMPLYEEGEDSPMPMVGGLWIWSEVEVDFGEWLERPTLKLFEEFGLDITKLEA